VVLDEGPLILVETRKDLSLTAAVRKEDSATAA
jgi:hypothetical protein